MTVQEYDASTLKTLIVKNSSGDINITASKGTQAIIAADTKDLSEKCKLIQKIKNDQLIIEVQANNSGWFNFSSCDIDFDIKVPAATALHLNGDSSNLNISQISGAIEFKLGSGTVSIDALSSKISGTTGSGSIQVKGRVADTVLKTGSGSITALGLTGNAIVESGSGSLEVTYKDLIEPGKLEMNTGSGSADLYLPKGMRVATSLETGSGGITNNVQSTDDANFKVIMRSGSGSLNLATIK